MENFILTLIILALMLIPSALISYILTARKNSYLDFIKNREYRNENKTKR